ncbi:MAG: hypothetical protein ACI9WS_002636 [Paraglaciecola psychrophila]|jgi:hypothetical protein
MSIAATDLIHHAIRPTLEYLEMYSLAAEQLLLATAAQESGFNPFYQSDRGIGIYQITPLEHRMIWDNYLAFIPDLASKVRGLASQHLFLENPDQELAVNFSYSTAIAWIIYSQSELQLPAADDADGLSLFWRLNFCHSPLDSSGQENFAHWIRQYRAA